MGIAMISVAIMISATVVPISTVHRAVVHARCLRRGRRYCSDERDSQGSHWKRHATDP